MPEVSVILPVYNGAAYLQEAIDSILQQTFPDFEVLVINDGSTDASEQIILSCHDPRIRYLKNVQNQGLIGTLNRGIAEAKGTYIARMDADDIALPERLQKQLLYLQQNRVAIISTRVKLIDAGGHPLPEWAADKDNVDFVHIKKYLRRDNCIAHPTVMGKTALFRQYQYRCSQKYSEDYDLWLRMIADGLKIEKLNEPLLLHRILPTSATRFKKINIFLRLAKVKFRFVGLRARQGRFSGYVLSVFLFALLDLLKAAGKEAKALLSK